MFLVELVYGLANVMNIKGNCTHQLTSSRLAIEFVDFQLTRTTGCPQTPNVGNKNRFNSQIMNSNFVYNNLHPVTYLKYYVT